MRTLVTICALVACACLMLGQPVGASGTLVLSHDEWALSTTGFAHAPAAATFAQNMASWFTGGGTGHFLVYSENFGLAGASPLCPTLIGVGHTCTIDTSLPFDLQTLQGFDGIFLAGKVNGGIPDPTVLIQYVEHGGHVYLAGGTGGFADASEEAAAWQTFLTHFGLAFDGSAYNGLSGLLPISSAHPLFVGVSALYEDNGSDIVTLDSTRPCEVLVASASHGRYAVCSALPPDPATVAPALDRTVPTSVLASSLFLYTGENPIQTGVAPGTIDARRVAVLRGRVTGHGGDPVPGATVTVLAHPEFGQTLTRADGAYDLVVNGGGTLVVQVREAGLIESQRPVDVAWQDYVPVVDMVLLELDPVATVVDLGGPDAKVARGSPVTDVSGTRRATLFFPPDVQATAGTGDATEPLSTLTVHLTEFTEGPRGPQAMPGVLPPTSAYTYAVEITAEEAGGRPVTLSRLAFLYVENFLGFAVGTGMPLGTYDRAQGKWTGLPNGIVLAILDVTGGLAELDTDGDGLADGEATLAALGVTDLERQTLATLYQPGQTLWRSPIPHFSPLDCNRPFRLPADARFPGIHDPRSAGVDDGCNASGSIIDCRNQALAEDVPLNGTPYYLHYQSDRQAGRKTDYSLDIELSGGAVPASLQSIVLAVRVAGRLFHETFPPLPDQRTLFTWDGKDVYGRQTQGRQATLVSVGYVYRPTYADPVTSGQQFAQFPGIVIDREASPIPGREVVTIVQNIKTSLGPWDALPLGLGAFTIGPHHGYDVTGKLLYQGTGGTRRASTLGQTVLNKVGIPRVVLAPGDDANADAVSMRPDGGYYVADSRHGVVYTVEPDRTSTSLFAGIPAVGNNLCMTSGDGGPANQAGLCPTALATAADGSLYVVNGLSTVRRIARDGIITTVAGRGHADPCVPSGEGGPATSAQLCQITGIAVAGDGTLYFAAPSRIYKVGADGYLSVVAGIGVAGFSGDGGPASQAMLSSPRSLALGSDGNLIVSDTGNLRIRRISNDGIITTIAGTGQSGDTGDGGPATAATFPLGLGAVAVGVDGSIYIDARTRVRVINPQSVIAAFAGNGALGGGGFGSPPTDVPVNGAPLVGFDGAVYIKEFSFSVLATVVPALPSFSLQELVIPSESGGEVYIFDNVGRHLSTRDAFTGAVRYRFGYDAAGRLSSVTDVDGKVTRVERDGAGQATTIVGPFGQRTTLALDADGYLSVVTDPAGGTYRFTYAAGGLLTSYVDPLGGRHQFGYDDLGRLISDEDPSHGLQTLSRSGDETDFTVKMSTALGRETRYRLERPPGGAEIWSNTLPDGTLIRVHREIDGSVTSDFPDGTRATQTLGPDPRFGMLSPVPASLTLRTPGGRVLTQTTSRTATLTNPADLTSLRRATETFTLNGKTFTRTYDGATKTVTIRSPLGRQTTATLNDQGRMVSVTGTSATAVQLLYDGFGRPTSLAHGARQSTLTYGADGRVDTLSNALGHTVRYDRDPLGRAVQTHWPDEGTAGYAFDALGDLSSLTPPSGFSHGFEHDVLGQVRAYVAPDAGVNTRRTTYDYNADHQLTALTAPDGVSAAITYDGSGRPSRVALPEGAIAITYDPSGRLSALDAPGGVGVALGYDGSLPTDMTWTGPIHGTVHVAYDNGFRVASESVNGEPAVVVSYDDDGLATRVGALTLARDASMGRVTNATVGSVAETYTSNELSELSNAAATCDGTTLRTIALTRNAVGAITAKTETLLGQSTSTTYDRDSVGRLTGVHEGARIATYTYDSNGNRLSAARPDTVNDVYDAQDRLVQHGSTTYAYTGRGQLSAKTDTSGTTRYHYDLPGNLRSVQLSSGRSLGYVIDGMSRRIGKTVDGTITQGFLYNSGINIVAELDGNGGVISRFVYGTRRNAPDYMIKGGTTYRILSDHVGSPHLVVDVASCEVIQQIDYDEFGRVLADTNPGFQPFGFAGGLYDRDSGLIRFGARDYDPETGRWTAKDPLGFPGGDSNLYAYAANDPINFIDPTGLSFMQGLTDFAAGFGDTISFGLTRWVRQKLDVDSVVNPCSGWYATGGVAGMVVGAVATAGVGAEVEGGETLAAKLSDSTYFHYTDAAGYEGIIANNAIRANARNQVFLTQDMVSSSEALDVLFAGNPSFIGKGSHVIAIDATGLELSAGVQFNEVIHFGTLRLEGRVLFSGPNPF